MSTEVLHNNHHHDHDAEATSKVLFGFWIYIMSDCILFASIFATYIVLHGNTFGGPSGKELFEMPYVLIETFLLLISSFTYGLAMQAMYKANKSQVMLWLSITFLLGFGFICMEINEFHHLILEGNGPSRSAFLSAFFTLVGTHGLHVTCGLVWMIMLMLQLNKHGITAVTSRKLGCLSLFWHFLDIVWIFVFTIVYLMGVM
ncbi:cytochrome o ubiquinol oxidase subunit III [Aquella oligotrophica]|uniref:Cytochrome bo(3) ubiquinol oxidase subunit 3 n=1 Tax=Aquella oligotrophica TaxID=2067065 RepID=A0A2I7N3F5_9NEIS|nr:cytochrome o ubiquinol oxidase subunit III [Aquella oligotrophica]AUR50978.1 cytochrome o ubiquinol oxidase subunit III [Aquella oligotrophica]